ncbi:Maf family protein [Kyrpidia tusciae]|uniref:dTTP/UTP pyrophosphatase n=1 Tax=Kyrpidia tusciae (strain DSM 2912 / NBRC 15312 / T2) TaxID=562970 RepID=D5WUP1_KYRT2|nr:Maf family protein [Kyrpidia tusciae]ADG05431.1 maf protein [Kyrpidia tusciae DSM 2912]
MKRELVLASGSPRREALLRGLGLQFDVLRPQVDEVYDAQWPPGKIVRELARMKARWGAARRPRALVIGADTLVVVDRRILGKPSSPDEAVHMLMELQGRAHTVYSGVAVIDAVTGREETGFRATEVRMRPFSKDRARAYVKTGEPMDKAGAYAIQGVGALLIDSISGDFWTVVGLPLELLDGLLQSFDVELFPDP